MVTTPPEPPYAIHPSTIDVVPSPLALLFADSHTPTHTPALSLSVCVRDCHLLSHSLTSSSALTPSCSLFSRKSLFSCETGRPSADVSRGANVTHIPFSGSLDPCASWPIGGIDSIHASIPSHSTLSHSSVLAVPFIPVHLTFLLSLHISEVRELSINESGVSSTGPIFFTHWSAAIMASESSWACSLYGGSGLASNGILARESTHLRCRATYCPRLMLTPTPQPHSALFGDTRPLHSFM